MKGGTKSAGNHFYPKPEEESVPHEIRSPQHKSAIWLLPGLVPVGGIFKRSLVDCHNH